MYVLDTNVVCELPTPSRRRVTAWAVLELEMGVLQIERRDPTQAR